MYKDTSTQVHTLRRIVKEKDEAIQRQCNLEKKIHELEKQGTIKIQKKGDGDISILASAPPTNGIMAEAEGFGGVHAGAAVGFVGPSNGEGPGMFMPPPPPPPPPPPMAASSESFGHISLVCVNKGTSP